MDKLCELCGSDEDVAIFHVEGKEPFPICAKCFDDPSTQEVE
jgi:hypothetical protein